MLEEALQFFVGKRSIRDDLPGLGAWGWVYDNGGKKIRQFKGDGGRVHLVNLLAAVRSRRTTDLNAPILNGHISSACCHLGNVSYQLGEPSSKKILLKALADASRSGEITESILRHLAANKVDLKRTPPILGSGMTIDRKREIVTGVAGSGSIAQARALFRRKYRARYLMPKSL